MRSMNWPPGSIQTAATCFTLNNFFVGTTNAERTNLMFNRMFHGLGRFPIFQVMLQQPTTWIAQELSTT